MTVQRLLRVNERNPLKLLATGADIQVNTWYVTSWNEEYRRGLAHMVQTMTVEGRYRIVDVHFVRVTEEEKEKFKGCPRFVQADLGILVPMFYALGSPVSRTFKFMQQEILYMIEDNLAKALLPSSIEGIVE